MNVNTDAPLPMEKKNNYVPRFYLYTALSGIQFQQGIFILYLSHIGFTALQIGGLQTLLFLVVSFSSLPAGLVVERIGPRASAACGLFVTGASLGAQVVASPSWPLFATIFAAHATGLTLRGTAESVILYELADDESNQTADSFAALRSRGSSLRALVVAGSIVIGGFLQHISWGAVYWSSAAASVIAAASSIALLPPTSASHVDHNAEQEDATVGRWSALRQMGAAWAFLLIISSLMHGTLTPYIIYSQDILAGQSLSTTGVAVTMASVYLLGIIAPLAAPWMMKRIPVAPLVAATLSLMTAGLNLTSRGWLPVSISVVLVAASIPEVTAIALDFAIQDRIPSRFRGSLTGLAGFVEAIIIAGAYLGFGAFSNAKGLDSATALFASLPGLGLVILIVTWRLRPLFISGLNDNGERNEAIHDVSLVEP